MERKRARCKAELCLGALPGGQALGYLVSNALVPRHCIHAYKTAQSFLQGAAATAKPGGCALGVAFLHVKSAGCRPTVGV